MKFTQLVALLPCYSLEDFDLPRSRRDAEQLLSAWSGLWHPLLLANSRTLPRTLPAASPPVETAGCLVVVSDCCQAWLPENWMAEAEAEGACVLRSVQRREDVAAAVWDRLGDERRDLDPDLTADFYALGFCRLQVDLLTRKQRYMSSLDETSLKSAALDAADAAAAGNASAAREHLQAAFDRLHEAREYVFPAEPRLLDLTLAAESTIGPALRTELAAELPRNVLIAGEVLDAMARCEPETLAALRQSLADGRAAIVGGEQVEIALPLLPPEAIAAHFRDGLAAYRRHLGRPPAVFGRRCFGLTPALPQILERTGFTAALHCTLNDGRFPANGQGRFQWEGIDGTVVEAAGGVPIDADRPESFLSLAERLSDAISLDDAPSVMFAHWPGRWCPWYDDLRRIAAYGAVLGKFVTFADYFEQTSSAGNRMRYSADEYRAPYLRQDVAAGRRDPISRWVRFYRRWAACEAMQTLDAMAVFCGKPHKQRDLAVAPLLDGADAAQIAIDDQIERQLHDAIERFAQAIAGSASTADRGTLFINPCGFSEQTRDAPGKKTPRAATVDVPGMGFSWVGNAVEPPADPAPRRGWFGRGRRQSSRPPADEYVLRNEFFEVQFDPQTGAIRSISDGRSRGPRLAQQIALRTPRNGNPDAEENYSTMAADEIAATSSDPDFGEFLCRGRLMDRNGELAATFRQTTRLRRGSRVIEIDIALNVEREPADDPWQSYYAARFAWKDETAQLHRSVNLANLPTTRGQFESPHFVDIVNDRRRTTILCGGLPYHRRIGPRMLDTLLATRGETARSFRLGIGIDVPHPTAAALAFLAPTLILPDRPQPASAAGWLFHLDCRNVQPTHWESLSANDDALKENTQGLTAPGAITDNSALSVAGFRVRLLETDGRRVRLGLRCFRNVASASKINPGDLPPTELAVEGDRISVPIGPHEWVEVEGQFA